ncbi:MAG: hypothetical protein ABI645_00440 [Pseudomonadota bacterium]
MFLGQREWKDTPTSKRPATTWRGRGQLFMALGLFAPSQGATVVAPWATGRPICAGSSITAEHRVYFRDLLDLPFDARSGSVDVLALLAALPVTPRSVIEQVFSDHGRKSEFQQRYGQLDLSKIDWVLAELTASGVAGATVDPGFASWTHNVERRLEGFSVDGWACIDVRPDIVAQWAAHKTWKTPPVLLDGFTFAGLHLMEGHTRIGVLRGALSVAAIDAASVHAAWIGRVNRN